MSTTTTTTGTTSREPVRSSGWQPLQPLQDPGPWHGLADIARDMGATVTRTGPDTWAIGLAVTDPAADWQDHGTTGDDERDEPVSHTVTWATSRKAPERLPVLTRAERNDPAAVAARVAARRARRAEREHRYHGTGDGSPMTATLPAPVDTGDASDDVARERTGNGSRVYRDTGETRSRVMADGRWTGRRGTDRKRATVTETPGRGHVLTYRLPVLSWHGLTGQPGYRLTDGLTAATGTTGEPVNDGTVCQDGTPATWYGLPGAPVTAPGRSVLAAMAADGRAVLVRRTDRNGRPVDRVTGASPRRRAAAAARERGKRIARRSEAVTGTIGAADVAAVLAAMAAETDRKRERKGRARLTAADRAIVATMGQDG